MRVLPGVAGFLTLVATAGPGWAQSWSSNSLPFLYGLNTAMSADGSVLATASGDNGVYVSTNYGATWTNIPQTVTHYGGRIACSADGNKIFVSSGSLHFACSTNSGVSWFFATTNAPLMNGFITASADGNTLVGGGTAGLFTSTNGGVDWITNFTGTWSCAACSADGSKWIAGVSAGYSNRLMTSTDFGLTWKTNNVPAFSGWSAAVSSADGNALVAVTYTTITPTLYVSTNGGASWTTNAAPMPYNTPNVAGSADLHELIYWLEPGLGYIYTSTNLGASWTSNAIPQDDWSQALVTADGNRLLAFKNRSMWVATNTPAPVLNYRRAGDGLVLSWIAPSVNLQLETAGELSSGWSAVTNFPGLNVSNLCLETTVPLDQASGFFRLSGAP